MVWEMLWTGSSQTGRYSIGKHPRAPEPDLGEDQHPEDDHDPEPERGDGDTRDRERPHRIVHPGVLPDGGDHPEGKRDQHRRQRWP